MAIQRGEQARGGPGEGGDGSVNPGTATLRSSTESASVGEALTYTTSHSGSATRLFCQILQTLISVFPDGESQLTSGSPDCW